MKFLLSFFFLILNSWIWAQCPTSDVLLSTQEEVDAFGSKYSQCTDLAYSLTIGPTDDMNLTRIENISMLPKFKTIQGNLLVNNNPVLTSIKRLEGIQEINGDFQVSNNKTLVGDYNFQLLKVGGDLLYSGQYYTGEMRVNFSELIKVGKNLRINFLKKVDFPELWKVGEDFEIRFNRSSEETTIPNLETVGAYVKLNGEYKYEHALNFRSLKSCNGLEILGATFKKIRMNALESCSTISVYSKIPGGIELRNLTSAESINLAFAVPRTIEMLSKIDSIHRLKIGVDDSAKEPLPPFSNLKSAVNLELQSSLTDSILYGLKKIEDLTLSHRKGIEVLKRVESKFDLKALRLRHLQGKVLSLTYSKDLDQLSIERSEMAEIQNLNLAKANIKNIQIMSNSKLTTLTDLKLKLSEVENLEIRSNRKLVSCQLESLCSSLKGRPKVIKLSKNGVGCSASDFKDCH